MKTLTGERRASGRAGEAYLPPGWTEPGRCSDHGEILVTPYRAGIVWRDGDKGATCCPSYDHTGFSRDRCMYCGRALFPPSPVSRVHAGGPQRKVCDVRCRVALFRWRRAHPRRVHR